MYIKMNCQLKDTIVSTKGGEDRRTGVTIDHPTLSCRNVKVSLIQAQAKLVY